MREILPPHATALAPEARFFKHGGGGLPGEGVAYRQCKPGGRLRTHPMLLGRMTLGQTTSAPMNGVPGGGRRRHHYQLTASRFSTSDWLAMGLGARRRLLISSGC